MSNRDLRDSIHVFRKRILFFLELSKIYGTNVFSKKVALATGSLVF